MLVDGQWIPTFPNARYLIAKEEFEYWDREADPNDADNIMDDSVRPIFEHGLADLVDLTHQICPESAWSQPLDIRQAMSVFISNHRAKKR